MRATDETPSEAARALVQRLHDEMRADLPTKKIMGVSLVPPPWTQERIDSLAALLDEAIDSRLTQQRGRRAA